MTGETLRDLLNPLIGKSGSISMVVRRIGQIGFTANENNKLTSVTVYPDGVNFSLFSQAATEVVLLLFDDPRAVEPIQTITWWAFGCQPNSPPASAAYRAVMLEE